MIETANPESDSQTALSPETLARIDAYWRAANHPSVGQVYLKDNPLLDLALVMYR